MVLPVVALAAASWFVCDGINRPLVWVVARPAGRQVTVTKVAKPSGRTGARSFALGRGEPGMGQIHYALGPGGRAGTLHLVNPGMVGEGATIPVATSVTLDGATTECRWLADMALNGVTARRGVTITRERGWLVYRSYDFARARRIVRPDGVQRTTTPSLEIVGGTEDGRRFRFVGSSYTYVVSMVDGGALLTVKRGSRVAQTESFLGFTLEARRRPGPEQ